MSTESQLMRNYDQASEAPNESSPSSFHKQDTMKMLESTVKCVDRIIFHLGDASHRPPNRRKRPLSNAQNPDPPSVQHQSPPGLEAPFQELCSALRPCLVDRQTNANIAGIIMGMRGNGKSMMVERCLHYLASQKRPDQQSFRIVRLNGILLRGNDITAVVKEIVKQLSELAMEETSTKNDKVLRNLLRLRLNSSFTSNLSLLDDVLKLACVDGIPVLMVLDELDRLLGSTTAALEFSSRTTATVEAASSERQLLLYHLLDRVTTQGSSLCLIALTSHLATVGLLEKRVRSRAEGASKVIYVKPFTTYNGMAQAVLTNISKVESINEDEGEDPVAWIRLFSSLSCMLVSSPGSNSDDDLERVHSVLERNFRLGKDLRWFGRVVSCALSLYHGDCHALLSVTSPRADCLPQLQPEHMLIALTASGASMAHCESHGGQGTGVATLGSQVDGMVAEPRIQALMDLSGPQIAIVFAVRRILARDSLREQNPKPLTFDRIVDEYQSSYKGSSDIYSFRILRDAFEHLLDLNLLRPSVDHSGGGPLQYEYQQMYQDMYALNLSRMPLHFPVDIHRELGEVIKKRMLNCSTALQEWGKQKNS